MAAFSRTRKPLYVLRFHSVLYSSIDREKIMRNEKISRRPAFFHELKTLPRFFAAVALGDKTFEIRKNDRDFQVGDYLSLREWDVEKERYSGKSVGRVVSYMTDWKQQEGYVVLAIRRPTVQEAELMTFQPGNAKS